MVSTFFDSFRPDMCQGAGSVAILAQDLASSPRSPFLLIIMPRGAPAVQPLCVARGRMARALGAAGRMLWRRSDLMDSDVVILDLVAEALARLAPHLRPALQDGAVEVLRLAPEQVQQECALLMAVALREKTEPACEKQTSEHLRFDCRVEQSEEGNERTQELVDAEAQAGMSFACHHLASRVAETPGEAIGIGLQAMAEEAVAEHAKCRSKVAGILEQLPVIEEKQEVGYTCLENDSTVFIPRPRQARLVALGTALRLRAACLAQAVAFLGWKSACMQAREEALDALENGADSLLQYLYTKPSNMRDWQSLQSVANFWHVRCSDVTGYAQKAFRDLIEEYGAEHTIRCMGLSKKAFLERCDFLAELGIVPD